MGTISPDSSDNKQSTMKHSLYLCVVLIAALGPAVEAFFLGPIAIGVGLGALAVTKGLILGSILVRSRTNSRGGQSYNPYQPSNHYSQSNGYYSHYTQAETYYYSSQSYSRRGKREIPDYSEEELNRMVREVRDSTLTDEWYMDMVKKDQDDCTKRLICEVSHKKASGQSMNSVEKGIIEVLERDRLWIHPRAPLSLILPPRLANTGRWEELDVSSSVGVTLPMMTWWP